VVAPLDFIPLRSFPSVPSLAPSGSFRPSLRGYYPASSLLRRLLTSPPLSRWRSPQVRCRIRPLAPSGSTRCASYDYGLRCSQPAHRSHPASLPVRVPTVESLLRASFSFASRLRFALHYGCRHRLRLAPFIQQDSAHAGHTGAANPGCSRLSAGSVRPPGPHCDPAQTEPPQPCRFACAKTYDRTI